MLTASRTSVRHLLWSVTVAAALFLGACSDDPGPWSEKELEETQEQMVEVAEAYAVLDICMPLIDEDYDARMELVGRIEADRYAKLKNFDTQREKDRLFDFYGRRGATEDQLAELEETYAEAYDDAVSRLTSLQVCMDTLSDFPNTIANMRVR